MNDAQANSIVLIFLRLAHIDAELKRVFQERESLMKERREAVLLDAKTRCRNFATEFAACLPREIRDMVRRVSFSV